MTQKYVNGVLVDMTTEEIAARAAEEVTAQTRSLIDFAYSQVSRTTAQISITINGVSKTFTPTDQFNARLNNKYQTLKVAGETSTYWIFDNGGATISLTDMENMAIAANAQWQPYFDTIETVIGNIMNGTYTTRQQVTEAFDAAYAA